MHVHKINDMRYKLKRFAECSRNTVTNNKTLRNRNYQHIYHITLLHQIFYKPRRYKNKEPTHYNYFVSPEEIDWKKHFG